MGEPNGYIQGSNGVTIELVDNKARQELPKKLTRPATAQVGDYLRIKAIGADGTMEVEAVAAPTGGATVPTKVSAFENDAGYTTEARVQALLAEFPTFKIEVVQELPAVGAEKTIYLVPFADDSGSYLEYLYVNGAWEVVGSGSDSGENNDVTIALTAQVGYKIAPTGTLLEQEGSTDHIISQTIPVSAGERYRLTCSANFGNSLYAIYSGEENQANLLENLTADATQEGNEIISMEVVMPSGALRMRVAWNKLVTDTPYAVVRISQSVQAALPLAGQTVAVIGDSIVEHNAAAATNFVDIIAAATGAQITNLGVGGTGYMAGQDEGLAFYQRVDQIPEGTQRVLLYGSGNDRLMSLGEPTDIGIDTLCGCINTTLDAVFARVPTAWVGVISPAPWRNYPPYEESNAMELMARAQAMICRRRGVPYLDLYHSSGLRPWDAEFRALAYSNDVDNGIHPDAVGHGMIAPQIQAFLVGAVGGGVPGPQGDTPVKGVDYFTPAEVQNIAGIAAGLVEVPEGDGGSAKWKRIGLFTATDNINPWIINADEDGNEFSCTEFRIRAKLCWFHLETNSTINRSISFYGDDGNWYPVNLSTVPKGFADVVKGENASDATATFKHPAVIDVTTHGGLLVAETIGEAVNNATDLMTSGACRNRGVPHGAACFSQLRISLGFPTNLVMAGSTVEIWGR